MNATLRTLLDLTRRQGDVVRDAVAHAEAKNMPALDHALQVSSALNRWRAETLSRLGFGERVAPVWSEGRVYTGEGILAALAGRGDDSCPYPGGPPRSAWMWGYTGATTLKDEGACVYTVEKA